MTISFVPSLQMVFKKNIFQTDLLMEEVERIVTRIYKYYFISEIFLPKICSFHIYLLHTSFLH